MHINRLERISDTCWRIPPREGMRVPAIIFADEGLTFSALPRTAGQGRYHRVRGKAHRQARPLLFHDRPACQLGRDPAAALRQETE
jgi:hypothetical protein